MSGKITKLYFIETIKRGILHDLLKNRKSELRNGVDHHSTRKGTSNHGLTPPIRFQHLTRENLLRDKWYAFVLWSHNANADHTIWHMFLVCFSLYGWSSFHWCRVELSRILLQIHSLKFSHIQCRCQLDSWVSKFNYSWQKDLQLNSVGQFRMTTWVTLEHPTEIPTFQVSPEMETGMMPGAWMRQPIILGA